MPGPITTFTLPGPSNYSAFALSPTALQSLSFRVLTPYPAAVKSLIKVKLSNPHSSATLKPSDVPHYGIFTVKTVFFCTAPAIPTTPIFGLFSGETSLRNSCMAAMKVGYSWDLIFVSGLRICLCSGES